MSVEALRPAVAAEAVIGPTSVSFVSLPQAKKAPMNPGEADLGTLIKGLWVAQE